MTRAATAPSGPGGRPKKAEHERRCKSLRADVTIAEQQHVAAQAKAAGVSVGEYIRRRALGLPVVVREAKTDARLVHELNAIGVNLNQIAKLHNAGRVDTRTGELDELMRQLRQTLDKAVDQLDD